MRGKSSFKWYKLANEEFGQERYVRVLSSKGEVRRRFRLRCHQHDSWETCMCQDGRCELCDECLEDTLHLIECIEGSLRVS